jgi:hypothetical protein
MKSNRTAENRVWVGMLSLWLFVIVAADSYLIYQVVTGWLPPLRIVLVQPWLLAGIWIDYKALRRRIADTGSGKSLN